MLYRVAIRVESSTTWRWKSTALSSLNALFHLLRVYRPIPQDRLRKRETTLRDPEEDVHRHEYDREEREAAAGHAHMIVPLIGFFFLPTTTLAYAWLTNTHRPLEGVNLLILMVAVLIAGFGLFTWATKVSVRAKSVSTAPTVQRPVLLL